MTSDFWEHVYRVAEITGPILLYMWNNRRKAKKESDKKHAENQKKIEDLQTQLGYCPPHVHTEEKGILKAEGIYPKRRAADGRT